MESDQKEVDGRKQAKAEHPNVEKGDRKMSTLSVKFNQLDSVISDLNRAEGLYTERIEHLDGVKQSVNGITNEFGYLDSASFQLSCKIDQLEGYRDEIATFRDRVVNFRDTAYDEESGLAARLYQDSNDFMHDMGITPEYEKSTLEKLWEGFCEGVSSIFEAIADFTIGVIEWVQENWDTIKQVLVVVGEVLIAAVAITTFILTLPASGVLGVLGAIGAGWAAFKATTDVICDSAALGYYLAGDKESGDKMAEYDARHLFHDAGEGLNSLTGWDHFDEVMDVTYFGLDVVETVFKPGADAFEGGQILKNTATAGKLIKDIPDKGIFALTNIMDFSCFDGKEYGVADKLSMKDFLFGKDGKLTKGGTYLDLGINFSELLDFESPDYKNSGITKTLKDIKTLTGIKGDGKHDFTDTMRGIKVFGNVISGDSPLTANLLTPMMPLSPLTISPIGSFGGGIGGGGFRGGTGFPTINPMPSFNININVNFSFGS